MDACAKLQALEEAAHAADTAMAAAQTFLRDTPAPTSEQAHKHIREVLERLGYDAPEGIIVAGGTTSADPHAPGSGLLRAGEPIVIDIYPHSRASGYFGDLSRTVCIGVPSPRLLSMYTAVVAAQTLAAGLVHPGVRGGDVYDAVLEFFTNASFPTSIDGPMQGEGFIHGVGHGVGQAVHESPRIGVKSGDVLKEGDVITIEPGLYYKNIGGVRIEDMYVVEYGGCRKLTSAPVQCALH